MLKITRKIIKFVSGEGEKKNFFSWNYLIHNAHFFLFLSISFFFYNCQKDWTISSHILEKRIIASSIIANYYIKGYTNPSERNIIVPRILHTIGVLISLDSLEKIFLSVHLQRNEMNEMKQLRNPNFMAKESFSFRIMYPVKKFATYYMKRLCYTAGQ